MITLYQYRPLWGIPNPSPFCMKVENYLRMTGTPYQVKITDDPRKAPKGKLPYIEDGEHKVADSTFILDYLKQAYGDKLDASLSPGEKATSLAFQRLFEEDLYWVGVHFRFLEDAGWKIIGPAFFGHLPTVVRAVLGPVVRKAMRKRLLEQGLGRHSREEIVAIGERDLRAISDFLGKKPFLMGDHPTSIDAVAYGFLANIIEAPILTPVQTIAKGLPNLVEYCARMKNLFYKS
jgi:glutathione S-transferase